MSVFDFFSFPREDDQPLGDNAVADLEDAPEDEPGEEGDNSELAKDYPNLAPAADDPSDSV